MTNKFESYYQAQSWLVRNIEIYQSTRQKALEIICKKTAEVMNIQRVGIWMYTINRESIFEEMTFIADEKFTKGEVLARKNYPIYFKFLEQDRVIISNNTRTDIALSEFLENYMIPLGVHALLDAPIYSDGEIVGIVCCEDKNGPRDWDLIDKSFAASVADFVGRLIESEKRHTYENELKHRIDYLENDLRKKLEDLKEAKFNLDLALESAQAGKWDWHIDTGKVYYNKTWVTRLGYDFHEIPQEISTFRKFLHPDDIEKVFSAIDDHLEGKTLFFECRYRLVTKTGEIQFCIDRGCVTKRSQDGHPLRMTGVNVNITPIVQLEQSLISSQQQLQAMIRSLPNPVAMFDKEFRYLAYSTRWEQEWGTLTKIEVGEKVEKVHNDFKRTWVDQMKIALSGQTVGMDEDYVHITDDRYVWLRWIIQPWKLATGEIGGVIIMCENITNRKEAEMRMTQSSKLSALGEMAGGIAHEINNPLSIIKGYIDLLRRHSSRKSLSQENMLQYVEKMDQTVSRISRIVNGMRRFSRESYMDEKIPYSLNKIIDETLDICLERINNNGTSLDVEYFVNDPIVSCRPVELSQVLLNLINNSFQAVSEQEHPWIKISCKEQGDYYQLFVVDSGKGIPVYIRHKLFQPFFTTKDIGVGTGLGLSISRGIVEEHDGHLTYQADSPNTTFLIELPKLGKEKSHKGSDH